MTMNIEKVSISIRELAKGYNNESESGKVTALNGSLNIRPAYQREFVYKDAQQKSVIESISNGFPLSIMYWAESSDGWEILDGQQRTMSICEYINGSFSLNYRFFHNLDAEEQASFLDYELDVYKCSGSSADKLKWFRVINIAGEKLTEQELRNSIYYGPWLSSAKSYFSKPSGGASEIAKDYVKGSAIRQDYLEVALKWISEGKKGGIENFMAERQNLENANELKEYFKSVIGWVENTFVKPRKEMKGVDWGFLFNVHGKEYVDTTSLEEEVTKLMRDEEVTNKSGIYEYVLNKNERALSIRSFTANQKRVAYEKQGGVCPCCKTKFNTKEMEGDHITPWSEGGTTTPENLQMLCKPCNRKKSNK